MPGTLEKSATRLALGNLTLTALSDGYLDIPAAYFSNVTPAEQRGAVVRGLTDALERTEHHLLSGIVGTKFILPVLAQHGKLVRPRAHLFAALA